ncbi:MAG TPA: hypothetical protein VKB76_15195 [Ktedonobacterales bacterium]|nr:hypothetical protein [Ktedonobacterales bacterium]
MRAIDDPIPVYVEILQLLRSWGPLPESDVSRMLRQWMLVTNDFREMEEQGYIEMSFTGDEYLISMSVLGRLFLEQEQANGRR